MSAVDFDLYKDTHDIVGKVESFSGFSVVLSEYPPVKIALKDAIAVLVRKGCRKGK